MFPLGSWDPYDFPGITLEQPCGAYPRQDSCTDAHQGAGHYEGARPASACGKRATSVTKRKRNDKADVSPVPSIPGFLVFDSQEEPAQKKACGFKDETMPSPSKLQSLSFFEPLLLSSPPSPGILPRSEGDFSRDDSESGDSQGLSFLGFIRWFRHSSRVSS